MGEWWSIRQRAGYGEILRGETLESELSWAEVCALIGRFIPLKRRDGAELAFPAEFRGMARV
jgi:hypothetical protein